jgi:hypothetical protein
MADIAMPKQQTNKMIGDRLEKLIWRLMRASANQLGKPKWEIAPDRGIRESLTIDKILPLIAKQSMILSRNMHECTEVYTGMLAMVQAWSTLVPPYSPHDPFGGPSQQLHITDTCMRQYQTCSIPYRTPWIHTR